MLLREDQEAQLDVIQVDHKKDHKTCCKEMFWYWLKSNPDASWYQLVECLKSPNVELHKLAAEIEAMYMGMYFCGLSGVMCITCAKVHEV